MPTLQYPNNPNTDTAFVVQDDGTKNRALMTAPQDTSTLELPSNPNSTKGYVTIDGKKQRVVLTADITGGGSGGDQHNLGWYATESALTTAHPTAEAGDWAIVGATDTVWIWDTDNSQWVDSDQKGQVTSVNNQTGAVTVQETLVSGTNIKTINNQSVLGSGNISIGGGIDWTRHWDMPTSASGTTYLRLDCNMLPAGHYRFYQQSFNFVDYPANIEPDTYMIDFYVDSDNSVKGVVNRVMDGQSTFADYNSFESYPRDLIKVATFDSSSKLGFWSEYGLMLSNISTQSRSEVVNNVFRWTDIKNVDTNDTYTLTAYVDYDTSVEPSDIDNVNALTSLPNVNEPENKSNYNEITSIVDSSVFGIRLDNCGAIYYRGGNYYDSSASSSSVKIYLTDWGNSVFDAELFVEKTYCIINKATGIFANTEIVVDNDSSTYIKYNFSNQDVGTRFFASAGKAGGNCVVIWLSEIQTSDVPVTTYPVPCICVGRTVTPNIFGKIQQYTGTTNANYTNGYFYKASGTLTLTPSTATISVSSPSGASVSIDFDTLIPLLRKYYYFDYGYIIEQLTNGSECTYYANGSSVNILGNTFTQPDVVACFTVTGNDGYNVIFDISNFVLNGYSVSNGHWEQVDVQPGGSSLPSQTGNAGKFLTTDGTDASWGNALVNKAKTTQTDTLVISGNAAPANHNKDSVIIGVSASGGAGLSTSDNVVVIGKGASSGNGSNYATFIGWGANTGGYAGAHYGVALGAMAQISASHAIQIGSTGNNTNNSVPNTFRVANANGNYEIMSADGTIPADRLASTTGLADGNYRLRLTMANGVPTLSWVAE